MIRRRRPVREIPFSFDSFLDVVANVVGIIIKLILVVWVGARSYESMKFQTANAADSRGAGFQPATTPGRLEACPTEAASPQLEERRRELAEAQARLLKQMEQLKQTKENEAQLQQRFVTLASRRKNVDEARAGLEHKAQADGKASQGDALSLDQLKERQRKLMEEIAAQEKLPPLSQALRYQSPVSRPVESQEYLFECHKGKVTYINLQVMLAEIGKGITGKADALRTQWEVKDVTNPAGAFRLRYVVQRERSLTDTLAPDGAPPDKAGFQYGLSEWVAEPVLPVRGEAAAAALGKGSDFRYVVDYLDPQQAAVTFFVYPDSFETFRQLRDYLYGRNFVVTGRPLPEGIPIISSRRGSQSRGQ